MSQGDWDDHEAFTGGRGGGEPTRYTKCWYCPQRLPLRDIAEHARKKHPVESLRYTTCRHCGVEFPLNKIRAHAQTCRTSTLVASQPRSTPRHRAD